MTRRQTDEGLAAESARYRRQRNEARNALVESFQVLAEFQEAELRRRLDGVFAQYDDFQRLIGRENVVDESGRIDDRELELRVRALLAERPHLSSRVGLAFPR